MTNSEEVSINNLPRKYHFAYQYCEFLYNNLVSTLNSLKEGQFFNHSVKFQDDKEFRIYEKLEPEEIVDKLFQSDKHILDAFMFVYKPLIEALLFDYITYMSEILLNILKDNLVICYSLLRKPLKETLTILEMICKNPALFVRDFWNKEPKNVDPNRLSFEQKKQNIKEIVEMVDVFGIHSYKVIYEVRFGRETYLGFDSVWNRAIHLVTNREYSETEKRNLNFIFAGKEEKQNMLHHIFYTLPIILCYTNDVVEMLVSWIARLGIEDNYMNRRFFGYLAWSYQFHLRPKSRNEIRKILENYSKSFDCPNCKKKIGFNKQSFIEYCLEETISCQTCNFGIKGLRFKIEKDTQRLHPLLKKIADGKKDIQNSKP
jgi:hypothetical protein